MKGNKRRIMAVTGKQLPFRAQILPQITWNLLPGGFTRIHFQEGLFHEDILDIPAFLITELAERPPVNQPDLHLYFSLLRQGKNV